MKFPKHVAIIPDGNRTRARANDHSTQEAYLISYQRGVDLIKHTFTNTDVKVFTLRGLSTENAKKRPKEEFDFLMTMYKIVDEHLDEFLLENKVNFKRIGNPDGITQDFRDYLNQKEEKTKCDSDKYFVFAINYGGRDEILRGVKQLAASGADMQSITEEDITNNLELHNIPPIELVVRTKGDVAHRTSGFMSWWIGYAELYFTEKMCPELLVEDYKKALEWFDQVEQHRNY